MIEDDDNNQLEFTQPKFAEDKDNIDGQLKDANIAVSVISNCIIIAVASILITPLILDIEPFITISDFAIGDQGFNSLIIFLFSSIIAIFSTYFALEITSRNLYSIKSLNDQYYFSHLKLILILLLMLELLLATYYGGKFVIDTTSFGKSILIGLLMLLIAVIASVFLLNFYIIKYNLRKLINTKRRYIFKKYNLLIEADRWNKLGLEFCRFRSYDDAIVAFEIALEIDPSLPAVYNNIGKAFYAKRNYDLSIKYFEKAIGLDVIFAEPYFYKALAIRDLGDPDAAKQFFESAKYLGYKP